MDILFNAIAPIFLIVLASYLLGKFKIVPHTVGPAIMQYVFYAAAPLLVFYAIISNPIDKLLYWRFWIAYPLSLFIVIALTTFIFKVILRRSWFAALIFGFCAACANTVIIGYPVLSGFIGHVAALPMSVTIIAFTFLVIPTLIFICEIHANSNESKAKELSTVIKIAVVSTLKNPLVIAVIIGVICSVLNIKLPYFITKFSSYVGESLTPCALFAVGLELAEFKIDGKFSDIIIITLINLLIAPVIAIGLAHWLHLSPLYAVSLVVFSAVPTAKMIFVIANKYQIFTKEVAAVISMTTVFAIISIPLFTYIAQSLWPVLFKH